MSMRAAPDIFCNFPKVKLTLCSDWPGVQRSSSRFSILTQLRLPVLCVQVSAMLWIALRKDCLNVCVVFAILNDYCVLPLSMTAGFLARPWMWPCGTALLPSDVVRQHVVQSSLFQAYPTLKCHAFAHVLILWLTDNVSTVFSWQPNDHDPEYRSGITENNRWMDLYQLLTTGKCHASIPL